MPEPIPKSPWASSIAQLREIAEESLRNVKKTSCNGEKLQRAIETTFREGEKMLAKGDPERAYIMFFRCFECFSRLKKTNDFKQHERYFRGMIGPCIQKAVRNMEMLHEQLENMYEQHQEDVSRKKAENREGNENYNNEKKENMAATPIVKHSSMSSMVNGFSELTLADRVSLSSIELFQLNSKRLPGQKLMLIIDVRLKEHFEESSMKLEDVINVPETILQPGLIASRLEERVEERFRPYFKRRGMYEWVIIVDWFTAQPTSDPKIPIDLMLITLNKWDTNIKYKRKPVILEGGYDDWLSRYPHLTTNPKISPPRPTGNYQQVALAQISYPDMLFEPAAVIEKKPTVPQESILKPTVDRSTKPGFQDKKTEGTGSIGSENSAEVVTPPQAENFDNSNPPKSTLKNDSTESRRAEDSAAVKPVWSDPDEKEMQEKYAQKGRRSALPSAAKFRDDRDTELDDAPGDYRDEDEDENEAKMRNLMNLHGESASGMKRCSSTPNISKLSANEYSRPAIDRSTKPSNDDQLNDYSYEMGKGLTGLKNLGNTCYMNSIIQCLSNTDSLRKRLCSATAPSMFNERSKTRGAIAREVRNIMSQLWSSDGGSVSCKTLKATVGEYRDTFKGYEQQDSHEFLTILIDWLHEDLKCTPTTRVLYGADESSGEKSWGEFISKNNSIVRDLFYGQLRSTVCCSDCGEESVTFEPFSNLSLPLPPEERCTLAECLKLYISNESIPGWQCPSCNKPRNATKKLDITKLPPLLVIHFKRFTSDGWCRKRLTNVDFPNILDMTPFITGMEHRDRRYKLYAVSNHFGTMESGHYTACCLNAPTQEWFKFDDQDVSPLSSPPKSSSAYIVFYQSIR